MLVFKHHLQKGWIRPRFAEKKKQAPKCSDQMQGIPSQKGFLFAKWGATKNGFPGKAAFQAQLSVW